MLPQGLYHRLRRIASLDQPVVRAEHRWLLLSGAGLMLFTVLASWPAMFGPLVQLDLGKFIEFAR